MMRTQSIAFWLLAALGAQTPRHAVALEVSRTIPPLFAETLASRLTPPAQALAVEGLPVRSGDALVHILSERIQYVDEAGGRFTVVHRISQAQNDKGVEQLSEQTVGFRKSDQRIHLIEAFTRQADGKTIPIGEDAAFIQEPENDRDASLYTDVAELVVVFPNVKPGSTVHYTVFVEEAKMRIPGHFTATFFRSGYYPYGTIREVVDLPAAWSKRLEVSHTGGNAEPPVVWVPRAGRVEREWRYQRVAGETWEPRSIPLDQTGRVTRLTTLSSWKAMASWYRGLLAGREVLGTDAKRRVDELTRGLTKPAEIAQALFEYVADKVRYTGLEFGIGAYQPHGADEVLRHGYGDCKDKANLLRSMLRHKGVRSHLVLLNSEGPGRIDWRSPGASQFDHVILAIELHRRLLFVDPTVPHLAFGALPVGDSGRKVLVVRDQGVSIVTTPKSSAGERAFRFSLEQREDGSLAGWLEVEAKGVLGSYYRDYYATRDPRRVHGEQQTMLRDFFPSAELIDYEVQEDRNARDLSKTRTYFVVPPAQAAAGDRLFAKAADGGYLPRITQDGERRGAFLIRPERLTLEFSYTLPPGWRGEALSKPYSARTPEISVQGSWRAKGQVLTMTLVYDCVAARVPKKRFAALRNALAPVNAWLERPIPLVKGSAPVSNIVSEPDEELRNFPIMPSGTGQLALAQRNYPLETHTAQRGRALDKILMWFPQDVIATSEALIEKSRIAAYRDNHPKAIEILQRVLDEAGPRLPPETAAWAEYLLADNLRQTGAEGDAFAIALRLGRNSRLSPFRRGWAMALAAELSAELAPQDTIALAFEGMQIGGESAPTLAGTALRQSLLVGDARRFLAPYAEYLEGASPEAADTWTATTALLGADRNTDTGLLQAMLSGFDELVSLHPAQEDATAELAEIRSAWQARGAYGRIAARLEQQLKREKVAFGVLTAEEAELTDKDLLARAQEHADSGNFAEYLRLAAAALTRPNPDEATYGEAVWHLATVLRDAEAFENAYVSVLDAALALPAADAYHFEARFLLADYLAKAGAHEDAEATLHYVIDSDAAPGFTAAAYLELGKLLEGRSATKEAMAAYEALQPYRDQRWAVDGVMRAIWLRVDAGEYSEALAVSEQLRRFDTEARKASSSPSQVEEILQWTGAPDTAVAYWKASAGWWSRWTELLDDFVGKRAPPDPLIGDEAALATALQQAIAREDHQAVAAGLDRIMRAARLHPKRLLELTAVAQQLMQLDGKQPKRWLHWAMNVGQALDVDSKEVLQAKGVILVAVGIDLGEIETAARAMASYVEQVDEWQGQAGEAMARLRVILSHKTGKLDAEGLAILRQGLDRDELGDTRELSFDILVNAQRHFGLAAAERDTIEAEMQRPQLTAARRTTLQSRLGSLASSSAQQTEFGRALERWLTAHRAPWYDHAEPASLSDPRVVDVDTFLASEGEGLLELEKLKAYLLIARSSSHTFPQRLRAFHMALWTLSTSLPRWSMVEAQLGGVVDDEAFPRNTRVAALWGLLFNAALADKADLVKRWKTHSLTQHFNKKQSSIIDDAMTVLSSPGPRDSKFWLDAFQRPVGLLPLQFLMADIEVLAAQGEAKQIEEISTGFQSANLRPVVGERRAATELQLGRVLERLRRHGRAHAQRVEIAREVLADVQTPDLGTTVPDMRAPPVLPELPTQQGRREALGRLDSGRVMPDDFAFWAQFVSLQPNPAAQARLAGRLFNATLRRLQDDYELSRFLFAAISWFDIDDDAQWRRWKKAVRRFSDSQKYPQAAEVIACLKLRRATRTGTATQIADKLAPMKGALTRAMRQRMLLMHTLTRRDFDGLRQAVDDLPAEALAQLDMLRLSLPALTALKRNAELGVVKRRAKRLLYEAILQAWYAPTYVGGLRIARLAELLKQEAAVPADFDAFMADRMANNAIRSQYLARRASSQGRWLKAVEHSTVVLARWPTHYWYHWIKGRALAELN